MGNLTLTGYNAEYNDRPFEQKRDMPGGFKHSPLRLNTGLGEIDAWNEAAIQARAERLAEMAMAVWSAPQLRRKFWQSTSRRPSAQKVTP